VVLWRDDGGPIDSALDLLGLAAADAVDVNDFAGANEILDAIEDRVLELKRSTALDRAGVPDTSLTATPPDATGEAATS
jgi:hypothetical protein